MPFSKKVEGEAHFVKDTVLFAQTVTEYCSKFWIYPDIYRSTIWKTGQDRENSTNPNKLLLYSRSNGWPRLCWWVAGCLLDNET